MVPKNFDSFEFSFHFLQLSVLKVSENSLKIFKKLRNNLTNQASKAICSRKDLTDCLQTYLKLYCLCGNTLVAHRHCSVSVDYVKLNRYNCCVFLPRIVQSAAQYTCKCSNHVCNLGPYCRGSHLPR